MNNAGSPNGPIDGGIAVFASGNEYAPAAGFPGAADFCVSVAAVAGDGTPSTYTNYSTGTSISAPGGALREETGTIITSIWGLAVTV